MEGVSNGCGLCPWSCSGKVGAYANSTHKKLIDNSVIILLLFVRKKSEKRRGGAWERG